MLTAPRFRSIAAALLGALLFPGFGDGSPAPADDGGGASPAAGRAAKVVRGPFKAVIEAEGTFVPAQAAELSFWPRAYKDELRVAEVAGHGSAVHQGDVVLRLETDKVEDLVRAAEWTARAAQRSLADARVQRQEYDTESQAQIARAEMDLELARQSLKGHKEVNRPLEKDEFELGQRSYRHNIEDQEDELAQLGKMYKEDELTEETEEIVLKRAKRNLDESRRRLGLFERRRDYSQTFNEPSRLEGLENAVKDREKTLRDLRRARDSGRELGQIALERLEHEAADSQKQIEKLRQDLEHCTFRAPQDGTVLHASFEEKAAASLLRRGAAVQPRQTLLTVARTGTLKARFSLKEKDRHRLRAGMSAAIIPEALPEVRLAGSLEPIAGFPLLDNTWNAHVVFGHEDERLLPLLKCKVVVTTADHPDALLVPAAAVFSKDSRSICYLHGKSPFGIVVRTVIPGPTDGKVTIIHEGLCEGEEVLLKEPAP